jgi:hypothetical protein
VEFAFIGRVIEWRGPSPYYYAEVPPPVSEDIAEVATSVSYGWGAIPVEARIGGTAFSTSLFPKDGRYLLPLRDAVRRTEGIGVNDRIAVEMALRSP